MEYQPAAKNSQADLQNGSTCRTNPTSDLSSPVQMFGQLQPFGNRAVGRLIQAKLKISEPGDLPEQEADRVADEVMRIPNPASVVSPVATSGPTVHRACDDCEAERPQGELEDEEESLQRKHTPGGNASITSSVAASVGSFRGGGEALPQSSRSFFEPRFNRDFSQVRIHTDARAAESASQVGARAYAVGRDIVFGAGEYEPTTTAGRRLLAHELAHTLQTDTESRLSRECARDLEATPIPANDSVFNGHAFGNLGRVAITSDISAGPLAGQFHVKVHVPRELQRLIAPGFLGNMRISGDISLSTGATPAVGGSAANELCFFVTFRSEPGEQSGSRNWYADFSILPGGNLDVPLQLGLGTATVAPSLVSPASGSGRIQLRLTDALRASVGPITLSSMDDVRSIWSRIQDQVRNTLALQVGNIQIPLDLRTRAAVTVPVPVPGSATTQASVIPVNVLGEMQVSAQASTSGEGFTVRLVGQGSGSALANLVVVEVSGRGRLRGPLPSSVRLSDLSSDFLRGLIAQSEGSGDVGVRFSAFGLPGRLNADFRFLNNRLVGNASFLSPAGIGGGSFTYNLDKGLSADLGMLGLTSLIIAPADERLGSEASRATGPPGYDLGTSVTGVGVTGVRITPSLTQVLSVGVGPQFVTTPDNRSVTGAYGGLSYQLFF